MIRLVVLRAGAPFADVTGRQEAVYLGSRGDCQIRVEDERIAPQHFVIYPEEADWYLQPLVDRGDLILNDRAIDGNRPLSDGDRLTLLDLQIQIELQDEPDLSEAPAASSPADPPEAEPEADTQVHSPDEHVVESMARFVKYTLPQGTLIRKLDEGIAASRSDLTKAGKVNVALSGCELPEQVMDITLRTVQAFFSPHRAWVGLRRLNYGAMEYVEGRLLTGKTCDLPQTGEDLKPRVLDRNQFALIPTVDPDMPCSVLTGPLTGPDGTLGMIYIDTEDRKRRFTTEEMDLFILLLSTIGAQLDAIFKRIAKQRAATVEGEVAVTHAIQARLTPRKLPQWDELQFGAFREPGRDRSSDIYDIVRLSNGIAAVMIAHARSTGSLPCQHMAQTQAAFRTALMHMDRPHVFMKSLNVLLYDGLKGHELHCFMGAIDPASGKMQYAMAGDIGAYVISSRGEERSLAPADGTPPIGTQKAAAYEQQLGEIGDGETLVLFTPGVVTTQNSAGEVFGEERFLNILCDGFGQLASTMLKEMLSDLQAFTEGGTQPEDITVILSHRV